MIRTKASFLALVAALIPALPRLALGQEPGQLEELFNTAALSIGEGWAGFLELGFLVNTLLTLLLATLLGALIAYHPNHMDRADTIEEIEAPKVHILYAFIGALIGILVVHYGLVVGMVLFGIGGVMRFRTQLVSAGLTGRVIVATLVGLSCGLDLPHVAVIATLFAFVLISILEARVTYRVDIRALAPERIPEAAAAYRALLEQHGCKLVAETKNPGKGRITLLIACSRRVGRAELEALLEEGVQGPLKGSVDWQTD